MNLLARLGLHVAALFGMLVFTVWVMRFWFGLGVTPTPDLARDVAIALAGVFGAGYCWYLAAKLRAREVAAEATRPVFTGQHFEANQRVVPQVMVLGVLVALGLASLHWAVVEPHWLTASIALLLVVTTLGLGQLAASQRRNGRPTLVMDGRGLDHAWFGRIPWDQVHGIALRERQIRHNRIFSLMLGVDDPHRYLGQLPRLLQLTRYRRMRTEARAGVLEIPLNPLNQPPHAVMAAAVGLRDRVQPPLIASWHPDMSEADVALARDLDALGTELERMAPEQAQARLQELKPRMAAAHERALQRVRRSNLMVWLTIAALLLVVFAPLAWRLLHAA